MITKVKPINIYCPIERVDDEKREITAYAFTQEVVDGEGGRRLKRSAMEAATPDYMQWANVRRMHQPDAVAVASSVEWDKKGALMTVRVSDDDAWQKVKDGVYKGLSVGVRPTLMRGNNVESCLWFETSLVDRPKDAGTKFLALRADGIDDGDSDCEVEDDDAEAILSRGDFKKYIEGSESNTLLQNAFSGLQYMIYNVQFGDTIEDKPAYIRTVCKEFADYITPFMSRSEVPSPDGLLRLDDGQAVFVAADVTAKDETISRLMTETGEQAETIGRVEGENATLRAEVVTLKNTPAQKPVYKGGFIAVDKEFADTLRSENETTLAQKQEELKRLMSEPLGADDPEGMKRSHQISSLKLEIQRL